MKRILLAALLPLLMLIVPTAAHAGVDSGCSVTTDCISLYLDGTSPHMYMNVKGGVAAHDTPIVMYPATTDGHEDFQEVGTPDGNAQLEYAPHGTLSGFCMSVPTLTEGTAAVLRNCAVGGNEWQDFALRAGYVINAYTLDGGGGPDLTLWGAQSGETDVFANHENPDEVWTLG